MVVLASLAVGQFSSIPDGLVSLGVGLVAVWLSRWVFVTRENRRMRKPQKWNDTLPLTLVAMLITAVVIMDRHLGLSAAAFVGLGVGWAAVLLLDVFGERVINMLRAGFAVPPDSPAVQRHLDLSGHDGKLLDEDVDLPPEMSAALKTLDQKDKPQ